MTDGLAVRRRRAASAHGARAGRGKPRWIVRSTNNGFTASVDPYGRIFEPFRRSASRGRSSL